MDSALNVLRMKEGDFARMNTLKNHYHWMSETCGAKTVVDCQDEDEIFAGKWGIIVRRSL